MRYHSPSVIGGLSFERLSFGHLPISILGVRHVPSWNADNLGIGALNSRATPIAQAEFASADEGREVAGRNQGLGPTHDRILQIAPRMAGQP